jgi:hypothetical protein
MAGPAEGLDVQLEHGDAAAVDGLAQDRRATRVQLDGEHATSGSGKGAGQGAVAGAEVDDHVPGTDRRSGDQAIGVLRRERVPAPEPGLLRPRLCRGHGGP